MNICDRIYILEKSYNVSNKKIFNRNTTENKINMYFSHRPVQTRFSYMMTTDNRRNKLQTSYPLNLFIPSILILCKDENESTNIEELLHSEYYEYNTIHTLKLNGLTNIDDRILCLIGSHLKHLKNFNMGPTSKVTDIGMDKLLKNTRLIKFKIYACISITDESFVQLKNHTDLKVLYMDL